MTRLGYGMAAMSDEQHRRHLRGSKRRGGLAKRRTRRQSENGAPMNPPLVPASRRSCWTPLRAGPLCRRRQRRRRNCHTVSQIRQQPPGQFARRHQQPMRRPRFQRVGRNRQPHAAENFHPETIGGHWEFNYLNEADEPMRAMCFATKEESSLFRVPLPTGPKRCVLQMENFRAGRIDQPKGQGGGRMRSVQIPIHLRSTAPSHPPSPNSWIESDPSP